VPDASVAVSIRGVTKTYHGNRGVKDLSLDIAHGEIFGFLGPNGAGKTTTIRMLLNLIRPDTGQISIYGKDAQADSVEVKRDLGYLPGEFALYPAMAGGEILRYLANLRKGTDFAYAVSLAERLDLDLSKKFRQYSRGNKQKLGIVQAFMHKPRLLILDEPTGGLDPLNQKTFLHMVEEAAAEGRTVFFSSHIMSEVERACTRVAIIREGALVTVGDIAELRRSLVHRISVTFAGPAPAPIADITAIGGVRLVDTEQPDDHTALFAVRSESLDAAVYAIAKYEITNLVSHEPSLEELFLASYSNADNDRGA